MSDKKTLPAWLRRERERERLERRMLAQAETLENSSEEGVKVLTVVADR